eukprot:SAG31_NODE_1012_length_10379_cov_3.699319_10_plen_185_part_00
MAKVGNFCKDRPGENTKCFEEERSHFGLWYDRHPRLFYSCIANTVNLLPRCMMSSPLILGFNMSNEAQMDRVWPIITNTEAIAIDHAWAGSPGTLYKTLQNESIEIWAKPLPNQKVAVLVLNAGDTNTSVTVSVQNDIPGSPKGKLMRDVWNHKDVTIDGGGRVSLLLNTHDSMMAIFQQTIEW